MADFKGCDIHDKEFPHNLVKAETVYKLYVQKEEFNPKTKRKETTAIYCGPNEGIDSCHTHMMSQIIDRLVGMKTEFTWKRSHWEQVEKTNNKTGEKYKSLERIFDDIEPSKMVG